MRERPILFNGAMVRAILEGRKTQTRRIVKPQPPVGVTSAGMLSSTGRWQWLDGDPCDSDTWSCVDDWFDCPLGHAGDRIWVRETWAAPPGSTEKNDVAFRADHSFPDDVKWCPSIHMPRWASRITLEITGVRVERLQDISAADVLAEGGARHELSAKALHSGFKRHWFSIYGPAAWAANPWVWVIEFRRVK